MRSSHHDCQHYHRERIIKCTIIYCEDGYGKQCRKLVRVLKSWTCELQRAGVWPILKDLAHSPFGFSGILFLSFETWLFPTFITNGLLLNHEMRVTLATWLNFSMLPLIVALWLGKMTFDYWSIVLQGFGLFLWPGKAIFCAIHFLSVTWPDMVNRWVKTGGLAFGDHTRTYGADSGIVSKASTSPPTRWQFSCCFRLGTASVRYVYAEQPTRTMTLAAATRIGEISHEDDDFM